MRISLKHLSPRHTAALLAAPLLFAGNAPGEDYRFLVSGYPAASVSHSSPSTPITLAPGAVFASIDASGTDMRSRVSAASEGIALRSDKALAFTLIVR